jgi:Asp-tRNA(Asn)/Glu-tRNA(Gln) amidotransferase C subunit
VPAEPTPVEPITNPHPLVAQTRKGVAKEKAGDNRLLCLANAERFDVKVSKQAFQRALRVFDALLKAAEACGS